MKDQIYWDYQNQIASNNTLALTTFNKTLDTTNCAICDDDKVNFIYKKQKIFWIYIRSI